MVRVVWSGWCGQSGVVAARGGAVSVVQSEWCGRGVVVGAVRSERCGRGSAEWSGVVRSSAEWCQVVWGAEVRVYTILIGNVNYYIHTSWQLVCQNFVLLLLPTWCHM